MSNPARIEQTRIPAHQLQQHGFRVYRDVLDFSTIETAQQALLAEFGGAAIQPLAQEDMSSGVGILSRGETGRALIAGDLGTYTTMQALAGDLPFRTTLAVKAFTANFSVHDYRTPNFEGTISLKFGPDSQLIQHRTQATKIIDDLLDEPYKWNQYRAAMPIARLLDRSVMKLIRTFELSEALEVPLGRLMLQRKGSQPRLTTEFLD